MNTGWLLAGFAPHSTMRSLSITSCSEHVVAATPIVCFSPTRRRGVAHARGRVDVGDAHGPRRLAGDVVHLVGDAAAREVERGAVATGVRRSRRRQRVERLVPRDRGEAASRRAGAASGRPSRPSSRSSALDLSFEPRRRRPSTIGSNALGRVDLEQPQPGRAQVHAVDRPVVEAGDAERAAVAHAFREHVPRVQGMGAVGPRHLGHVAIVVRLLVPDAVRRQADPKLAVPTAACSFLLMRGRRR